MALLAQACAGGGVRYGPAEEAMEAGDYERAERLYAELLAQRPDDKKARSGLGRARTAWLEKGVLNVTLHRAAQRDDEAMEALAMLVRKEREWKLPPPPGQDREAQAVLTTLARRVDELQRERRFIKAQALLEQAREAFIAEEDLERIAFRLKSVVAAGAEHCEMLWLAASVRTPFFARFVKAYCRYFGVTKEVPAELADKLALEMVGSVSTRVGVGGLEAFEAADLAAALKRAVESSPWYAPGGRKAVAVEAGGGVVFARSSIETTLSHPYVERVQFEAMEEYCEWVQVPTFVVKDGVETTVNESRCRTRTRFVPRYRDEQREYRYKARRYRQHMQVNFEVRTTVGGETVLVAHGDDSEESDITHSEDRPEIGLKPDPLELTARPDYLARQTRAVEEKLRGRLNQAWVDRYCTPLDDAPMDVVAEQVFRCLYARFGEPPAFADQWFHQYLGAAAAEVLGRVGWPGDPVR